MKTSSQCVIYSSYVIDCRLFGDANVLTWLCDTCHTFFHVQLYNRRKKAVHAGEESQRFDKLTVDFMSEESSDSDGGDIMIVHRPVWRSRGT